MAKRRRIEAGVKARVALAAVRGDRTTSQLVSAFGVHTTQVGKRQQIAIHFLCGVLCGGLVATVVAPARHLPRH